MQALILQTLNRREHCPEPHLSKSALRTLIRFSTNIVNDDVSIPLCKRPPLLPPNGVSHRDNTSCQQDTDFSVLMHMDTLSTTQQQRLSSNPSSCIPSFEAFLDHNHLLAQTLSSATTKKYAQSVKNFCSSPIAKYDSVLSLDNRIAAYIQNSHLKNATAASRQEMAHLLSTIKIMFPEVGGSLYLSRRCLTGWKLLLPAKSATPITRKMALTFCWDFMKENKYSQAAVLLICFAGMLRVSEALNLRWNDVAFPGDIRLSSFGRRVAGVNIRDSKTWRTSGKLQFVCIYDLQIIQFLRIYKKKTFHSPKFAGKLTYSFYLKDLKRVANKFGFRDTRISAHSTRIGKATEEWCNRVPVEEIAIKGDGGPSILWGTTCQTEEPGCSTWIWIPMQRWNLQIKQIWWGSRYRSNSVSS